MPAHGGYKLSTAANAAGMSIKDLNRNVDRNVIKLPGPAPGKGHKRIISLQSACEIAIGHAITKVSKVCASPTMAMKIAAKFNEPQRGRPIGGLFTKGRTVLVVCNDTATIHNVQPDGNIDSLLNTEAAIVVDLGAIINRVNSRLDTIR
jgi:hypothetical protein